jgi:hypothetical protein
MMPTWVSGEFLSRSQVELRVTQQVQMSLDHPWAFEIVVKTEISIFNFNYAPKEEYSAGLSYPKLPSMRVPLVLWKDGFVW